MGDKYTFELYEVEAGDDGSYTLLTSSSPSTGLTNTLEQYMCPDTSYAVSVVAPSIVQATDPTVEWTITSSISGDTVAWGMGTVNYCLIYGSIGTGEYCQSYPTGYPTTPPTMIPDTTVAEDSFRTFDGSIWNAQCKYCKYGNFLRVTGVDFQRTVGRAQVRTIEFKANFGEDANPMLVLANSKWAHGATLPVTATENELKSASGNSTTMPS